MPPTFRLPDAIPRSPAVAPLNRAFPWNTRRLLAGAPQPEPCARAALVATRRRSSATAACRARTLGNRAGAMLPPRPADGVLAAARLAQDLVRRPLLRQLRALCPARGPRHPEGPPPGVLRSAVPRAFLPARGGGGGGLRPAGAAAFHGARHAQRPIKFGGDRLRYYMKGLPLPPVAGAVTTWSFYQFAPFPADQLEDLRKSLLALFLDLDVRGRIYIATEGINAQLTCPDRNLEEMKRRLEETLPGIEAGSLEYNEGLNKDLSFTGLHVRIRSVLVNDGLGGTVSTFKNSTPQATHLPPAEFHRKLKEAMERGAGGGTEPPVVVDLRNHYESAIGAFEGAITLNADTYKDGYRLLREELARRDQDGKNPVFMYCTGGIRCTRSGSVLAQEGRDNVFVLTGGITAYGRFLVQNPEVSSLYKGKNFTFDDRLGEPVTDHVLTQCHSCPPNGHDGKSAPQPCDRYVNCANTHCDLFLLQCDTCQEKYGGTCGSEACLAALAEARKLNPLAGTRTPSIETVDGKPGSVAGRRSGRYVVFSAKGVVEQPGSRRRAPPPSRALMEDGSLRGRGALAQEEENGEVVAHG